MAAGTLERILEEVRTLSYEEKARLRDAIDNLLGDYERRSKEEELVRLLQAEGVVAQIPARKSSDVDRYRAWKPVEVQGKPLSETVVEERR